MKLRLQGLYGNDPFLGNVHPLLLLARSSFACYKVNELLEGDRHSVDVVLACVGGLGGVVALPGVPVNRLAPFRANIVPRPLAQFLPSEHVREDDRESHGCDVVPKCFRIWCFHAGDFCYFR